ncbi:MAG: tRNA (N6-isopentenyl adenosine(37)-C2)-methylthiotransferase MiaB [Actinomycetota bacterium]
MKAYIRTFGCQMNEYDSERIAYYLKNAGYSLTDKLGEAGIVIYNTCAVREKAKNRLYGHIGNLKKLKEEDPNLIICVGGCTAQNLGAEIQKDFPFVDIVFGTYNVSEIAGLIDKKKELRQSICRIKDEGFDYSLGHSQRPAPFKAYVPVITGCNNFCSYCIVPFVRGRERSLEPDSILKEVRKLADDGVVEVVLLGQNVNSYGHDLGRDIDFSGLLEKVSRTGIKRIRFMTSHPKDFSSRLVRVIKENDSIVNHIHLPLQSGSNKVLEKMNRKYTAEHYLALVQEIKSNIRNCSITTDIIVGFPGEEKEDFEKTLDMVKKVRFKRAFTFIYSAREGTAAARLNDSAGAEDKKEWFDELVSVQNRISYEENRKMEGKNFEALVEGISPKNEGLLQARLYDDTVVLFAAEQKLIGKIALIEIKKARAFYLLGDCKEKC